MKKKFSKQEALKEIKKGFAFSVIDKVENYDLDEEVLLKLLEDESNAIFIIDILDEFSCKKGDDIAMILIKAGMAFGVAQNLGKFSGLSVDVVYALIDSGVVSNGCEIASKLDFFEGKKSTQLALSIINADKEFGISDVALNLDKFTDLDEKIYTYISDSEDDTYDVQILLNQNNFSLDAQYKIMYEHGWTYSMSEKRHFTKEECMDSLLTSQREFEQKQKNHERADDGKEKKDGDDNTNYVSYKDSETSHYMTLDVPVDATLYEIKSAYRRLITKHHPDKGGDEIMAKKINEAYTTLSNPEKRRIYDLQYAYASNKSQTQEEEYNSAKDEPSTYNGNTTHTTYEQAEQKSWNPDVIAGFFWLGLGLLITLGTYAAASDAGGHYVISFGPIIYGLYRLFKI